MTDQQKILLGVGVVAGVIILKKNPSLLSRLGGGSAGGGGLLHPTTGGGGLFGGQGGFSTRPLSTNLATGYGGRVVAQPPTPFQTVAALGPNWIDALSNLFRRGSSSGSSSGGRQGGSSGPSGSSSQGGTTRTQRTDVFGNVLPDDTPYTADEANSYFDENGEWPPGYWPQEYGPVPDWFGPTDVAQPPYTPDQWAGPVPDTSTPTTDDYGPPAPEGWQPTPDPSQNNDPGGPGYDPNWAGPLPSDDYGPPADSGSADTTVDTIDPFGGLDGGGE